MLAQIALFHDLPWPEFIQQLGFADDAIAMIDQIQEQIEALAAEFDGSSLPAQFPAQAIDDVSVKRETIHSHCGLGVRGTHSQYLLDLSGTWSENQRWRRPVKGVSSTFLSNLPVCAESARRKVHRHGFASK
jgi:hypothetical protein